MICTLAWAKDMLKLTRSDYMYSGYLSNERKFRMHLHQASMLSGKMLNDKSIHLGSKHFSWSTEIYSQVTEMSVSWKTVQCTTVQPWKQQIIIIIPSAHAACLARFPLLPLTAYPLIFAEKWGRGVKWHVLGNAKYFTDFRPPGCSFCCITRFSLLQFAFLNDRLNDPITINFHRCIPLCDSEYCLEPLEGGVLRRWSRKLYRNTLSQLFW